MPRGVWQRFKSDDPLQFHAQELNGMLDVARQNKEIGRAIEGPKMTSVEFQVRNMAGADLDEFSILGLGDVTIPYSSSSSAFLHEDLMEGETPSASATIVVLQQPVRVTEIGTARLVGLTRVKVNLTDTSHVYAGPTTSTEYLTSSGGGPAKILWVESDASTRTTGIQWAVVQLGSFGGMSGDSGSPFDTDGGNHVLVIDGDGWQPLEGAPAGATTMPTITAPGAYVLAVHFEFERSAIQAAAAWKCWATLDDPGDGVSIYGPGFADGVPHPDYGGEGSANGRGALLGDHTFDASTTDEDCADVTWFLNVTEVPYTPRVMVQSTGRNVQFLGCLEDDEVVATFRSGCWYSLVHLSGGGGGTLNEGDGSVSGGGTGRSSLDAGQLLMGNGTNAVQSVDTLKGRSF